MAQILDPRLVSNAEPLRTVIQHNQKRAKTVDYEGLTPEEIQALEPEYEYFTQVVVTYDRQDDTEKHLDYKKETHEICVADTKTDYLSMLDELAIAMKVKVKEDILTLSDVDISKTEPIIK